jgi:hypothetical protein
VPQGADVTHGCNKIESKALMFRTEMSAGLYTSAQISGVSAGGQADLLGATPAEHLLLDIDLLSCLHSSLKASLQLSCLQATKHRPGQHHPTTH